ncbi:hypothetical protein [Vacuolonema iberomarrocanum]|nr:hypothetical protein [filamentous cyanobacterium LEGE 07170]
MRSLEIAVDRPSMDRIAMKMPKLAGLTLTATALTAQAIAWNKSNRVRH